MLWNNKSMDGVFGEAILGETKYEAAGLGMKVLPSMKLFLFPRSTGLRSWKNPSETGEKKVCGIGGSDAGPGDNIPANKPLLFISTAPRY